MLLVHIDTSALAMPGPAVTDKVGYERILKRLIWIVGGSSSAFTFTKSDTAASDLLEAGHFPLRADISEWIDLCEIEAEFDAKTITSLYRSILERTHSIVDVCRVECRSEGQVSLVPKLNDDALEVGLRALSRNAFSTASYILCFGEGYYLGLCSGIPDAVGNYSFSCDQVELTSKDSGQSTVSLDSNILCVEGWKDFLTADAFAIWKRAKSDSLLHLALFIKAMQVRKDAGVGLDVGEFFIGSEFFESLRANAASRDQPRSSVVFETCAKLLAGYPKYAESEFDKTRSSDGAEAYRTHITKHHDGLRLMYWKNGDVIEFANIGPKHELEIREGNIKEKYSVRYAL